MRVKYFITYSFITLLVTLLSITHTKAQNSYTIKSVPNVHIQDKTRYLSDPDQFIDANTTRLINQKLVTLEHKTGAEIVAIVLPSIGEEDCFTFAYNLFTHWGIGKSKADNGLLILLVVDQRCVQFITGYGLEGILPDYTCKQIQVQNMVPYLKKQNWSEGMLAGVNEVYNILYEAMDDGVITKPTQNKPNNSNLIVFILVAGGITFILMIVAGVLILSNQRKCPKCKKKTLQRTNSKVIEDNMRYRVIENIFTCTNCGHIVKRVEKQYKANNNNRGGGAGGPVIFGPMGGGRRGGGGFGGGSFGGGRSGGGGAGTRF